MTCAEVELVLPEILDDAPGRAFQSAFETHLRSCPDCSALVSDLRMISSAARELTETEEPSPRVWLRIAAELRAEGIIRETESQPARASYRPGRWSAWWLAPITAAMVAAGAYVVSHREAKPLAKQEAPTHSSTISSTISSTVATAPAASVVTSPPAPSVAVQSPPQVASNSIPRSHNAKSQPNMAEADASAEDQQFLSVVSTRAPSMRVTYQNQLQAVNSEIREVEAYLKQNPGDADARQQLMDAYQQKALLYQIALDRIQ